MPVTANSHTNDEDLSLGTSQKEQPIGNSQLGMERQGSSYPRTETSVGRR